MEGSYTEGWFTHPTLGLIKTSQKNMDWYYQCYTKNAQKALSKERPLDTWTWALSEAADIELGPGE